MENLQINNGNQQASYRKFTYTLQPGEVLPVTNPYNFFVCEEATAPFDVAWSTNSKAVGFRKGLQVHFSPDELYPNVVITNTAATANTISFGMGRGNFKDNRFVIDQSALLSVILGQYAAFNATTVALSDGKADIPVAAHTIIQNTSANIMYIGGTGTNGLQLQPGGTFEFGCAAVVTVYGTTGDTLAIGSFN